ncbi:MAG: flagellar biosynthetic protein FliO [Enhygromyxa sp.]
MAPLLALIGIDPLLLVGGVLLGLLAILSQLTRRLRGGGAGQGAGQGRQTLALTGQHAIHVVEIAGRRLLLGTGPGGAPQVLAELGEVDELGCEGRAAVSPPRRPFAELIERFGGLGGR